jgi:uncharacterized protein (UPF0261 family)
MRQGNDKSAGIYAQQIREAFLKMETVKRKGKVGKTIVVMGTLDTKGEEIRYVKGLIEARGHRTIVVDTGIIGEPLFPPDISHEEVARAAGRDLKEVATLGDEGKANMVMTEGASRIVQELHSSGKLDGIIAVGGSMGTSLGLSVMKDLPLGVPKLMVSTIAFTPFISPEVVSKDLTMMQSMADMWGLNRITEATLASAAGAISGMAEAYEAKEAPAKPLIGVTTLGTALLRYVLHAKPLLEQMGYEVAVFHSIGIGGRAFEQLIEQGLIAGALDLCPRELTCHLYRGPCDAGPNRLEAAGKRGIPQVVAPGGMDLMDLLGPLEALPARYRKRKSLHQHNLLISGVSANKSEMAAVGKVMAEKLNKATGPTALVIPVRGFHEFDRPGTAFYNPRSRRAFIETVKRHLESKVEVHELDAHINDPEFAAQAVAIFGDLMKRHRSPIP